MNFDGYTPQTVPRYVGLVQWDAPVQLPQGLGRITRNCRFTSQSVATRYGLGKRLTLPNEGAPITGIGAIRTLPESGSGTDQEFLQMLAYSQTTGDIYAFNPFVSASITRLTTDAWEAQVNFQKFTGLNPVIAQGFNRGFIAGGTQQQGKQYPLIYDPPTGNLDQASDLPFAYTWTPFKYVRIGQFVSPTKFKGAVYRCVIGSECGATEPPEWPAIYSGGTVNDGSVTWEEATPVAITGLPDPAPPITPTTAANAGSPILAGATVFLALTSVNTQGESINEVVDSNGNLDPARVLQWKNTTGGPVNLTVTIPAILALFGVGGVLGATYGVTSFNLYAYIVQGAPDVTKYTDPTYYAQVGTGYAPAATVTISAFPTGPSLPTVNTANVTAASAGSIDTGIRYLVYMFETRTDYITGWNGAVTFRLNITNSDQQLLVFRLPIGAYNHTGRVLAFTVAGASSAGPYTYVSAADVESPGFNQPEVQITATLIADNTTTQVTLNFTDTYLPGASDVTNYADRQPIPPCTDAYFSKALSMMVYTGCTGYQSGHLVSDFDDPEAVRVPGSNLQVADSDGDRCICWREVREVQLSFKENGCVVIGPNDGDPSTWAAQPLWEEYGPPNPKAVDIAVDDTGAFIFFVCPAGPMLVTSSTPTIVGRELIGTKESPGVWQAINWAPEAAANIKVLIDSIRREVRIMVPTGTSLVNNLTITLNYFFGWADPVVFAVRSGRMVPNPDGRKWSLDDISAGDGIYIPQRFSANAAQPGLDIAKELVIAGLDGCIYTVVDGQYHDDTFDGTTGYLSQWVGVPGTTPGRNISQLGGATWAGIGSGLLNLYAYNINGHFCALTTDTLTANLDSTETCIDVPCTGYYSQGFGIGFDNGGVADAWWEVHSSTLWIQPFFVGQIGIGN